MIAGLLTSMLRTTSLTGSSTILQSLIDAAHKDEIGEGENSGHETNLSNLSASKRSIKAGYLTFKSAKKGGNSPKSGSGNSKKVVKDASGSNYLISDAKKLLTTYGTHLHKRLSFNTLIQNKTSGLKSTRQAMPLVEFKIS